MTIHLSNHTHAGSVLMVLALSGCDAGCASVDPAPPAAQPVEAPVSGGHHEIAADEPAEAGVEAAADSEPAGPTRALEMTFVGDVIFGRYRAAGYDPIPEDGHEVFADVRELLESDILVGNLETPIVRELPKNSPIGSKYQFGASAEHAQHLVRAGFTAVSLANNHWFDQRVEGLEQTPKILEELGITPLGRARSEPPIFRVDTIEHDGWQVGLIAITTRTNAPQREGVAMIPYLSSRKFSAVIVPLVREARDNHDVIVVVVHWGDEYADQPARIQSMVARELIDEGVDLVVGHHPHVLQGIEQHNDGLIAYSLGNFLFENTHEIPRQTGVLRVRFRPAGRCLERMVFHPAFLKRLPVPHPVPATKWMGKKVRGRMKALSRPFGTQWVEDGEDLVLASPPCDRPQAGARG